ncbi:hypothetical protein GOQ27_03110 [Clostridium sp. D2Q-11]|uniref:Uncharacterized protein n=1 Tax=Anaeromonas frigoriresistens TaxID=2683708 RepID=A0A942UQI6_9FIRM|nr:hypothetical protein [Anaeromonas frigoriresistens]MBS4537434.1 hypothetical protein [Anaeromonas frigoriresistens]
MFSKNIDIDYNIISQNNIPLLVNNPEWKKLFGNIENKHINSEKNKLLSSLKKEKEYNIKLKQLQKDKRKAMVNIVNLSHRVNNDDDKSLKSLEHARNEIININEKIEDTRFELETIPREIRRANYELLKVTVTVAYEGLKEMESKLNPINDEIQEFRIKLKELIEDKNDYEEKINDTYTFLHGMIGKKEIEKLDKDFL